MSLSVVASANDHGSDRGPGLFARTYRQADGSVSSPVVTNLRLAGRERKRGSVLINLATALLMILAVALYAVSISAQWRYVMDVKHDNLIAWIEAASLDGGMAVFTLLALGLSRAGQPARIERLMIVVCALGSAAMNLAAADSGNIRSALAYAIPPLFLAAVVDRTVSVIRRHYLGDEDASAWHNLGSIGLYSLRLLASPVSTVAGLRRALLAATPVPHPPLKLRALPWPPAEAEPKMAVVTSAPKDVESQPVAAIERPPAVRPKTPKPRKQVSGPSKTSQFLELVVAEHGELSGIDLANVYAISKTLAPQTGLHAGSARTALRAAILRAQGGDAR